MSEKVQRKEGGGDILSLSALEGGGERRGVVSLPLGLIRRSITSSWGGEGKGGLTVLEGREREVVFHWESDKHHRGGKGD